MRLGGGQTIHIHVVSRLKNGWSYPSTPTYTFMVKLIVQVVPVHVIKLMRLHAFLTLSQGGHERSN